MQSVDDLGSMGETVNVARGYARNFLIPQGLAVVAGVGARKVVEEHMRLEAKRDGVRKGGAEALACVERTLPDAVILDLMMPEIDDFQVLEQIRSSGQTAELPVLVLTAKELTSEERARLTHNHIQELIQKGNVDREQLVASVGNLLRRLCL